MCDGTSPLGLPFEKEELEAFLAGLESVNNRFGDSLNADEISSLNGSRELLQELIHRLHHTH